jgi:rhodanese-related sulfurtransferase
MPVPRITREELKARLDAGNPPLIVDARLKYPYEHSSLTLPGAVRLAPEDPDLSRFAADREIVVFDSDPDEIVSAPIAADLIGRGIRAYALAGGFAEWMAASLPTEAKGARPQPSTPGGA